jgi:hypothetical protein
MPAWLRSRNSSDWCLHNKATQNTHTHSGVRRQPHIKAMPAATLHGRLQHLLEWSQLLRCTALACSKLVPAGVCLGGGAVNRAQTFINPFKQHTTRMCCCCKQNGPWNSLVHCAQQVAPECHGHVGRPRDSHGLQALQTPQHISLVMSTTCSSYPGHFRHKPNTAIPNLLCCQSPSSNNPTAAQAVQTMIRCTLLTLDTASPTLATDAAGIPAASPSRCSAAYVTVVGTRMALLSAIEWQGTAAGSCRRQRKTPDTAASASQGSHLHG